MQCSEPDTRGRAASKRELSPMIRLMRAPAPSPDQKREQCSGEDQKCEPPQRSIYCQIGCVATHWPTMHASQSDSYNYLGWEISTIEPLYPLGKAMLAWFVPPIVVPAMLIIAVIALALLR